MEEQQQKINELTAQLLQQFSQTKDWGRLDSFLNSWIKQNGISNTDASLALKNADTYLQSEEGKEMLRRVTDKAGSVKIDPKDPSAAIKKLLRELDADEKKQQQKLDKERKARIGKSVQNSISNAMKDIKPWKGLTGENNT